MNDRTPPAFVAVNRLCLGNRRLDLASGELLDADERPVPLRRQALEVLRVLGRRQGQVVTKTELLDEVWPGLVVGETSLAQAVSDIRRVLGDTGHSIVRTVARRGYLLLPAPASAAPTPPLSLVVLPVVAAAEPALASLAATLHAELETALGRYSGVRIVAAGTTRTAGARLADPRAVAAAVHVRYAVTASLSTEGAQRRLHIALIDGASGVQCWAASEPLPGADSALGLSGWIGRLRQALTDAMVLADVQRVAQDLPADPVSRSEALAAQAAALWLTGIDRGRFDIARQCVDAAVMLDPGCVRALGLRALLSYHGYAHGWLDFEPACRLVVSAARQLVAAGAPAASIGQSLALEAHMLGDWPAQAHLASDVAERMPSAGSLLLLGWSELLNDRLPAALQALERGLALAPARTMAGCLGFRVANAHLVAGRLAEAAQWGERVAATLHEYEYPPLHAAALWLGGDHAAARLAYERHCAHGRCVSLEVVGRQLRGDSPLFSAARGRVVDALAHLGAT